MSTQTKKPRAQSTKLFDEQQLFELSRLRELCKFERAAKEKGFQVVAGIDEAGRGPLAGPVVAASCIIASDQLISGIDDSKKLTPSKREELFQELTQNQDISYGIGIVSHQEIDSINIYEATKRAMRLSLQQLPRIPDYLLVDGMELSYENIPCQKIVHGDALSYTIAAASILAKVTRDRLMASYHEQWPEYGFDKHKGYGTRHHLEAIEKFGPCEIHRQTFEPIKSYCEKVLN